MTMGGEILWTKVKKENEYVAEREFQTWIVEKKKDLANDEVQQVGEACKVFRVIGMDEV